MSTTPENDPYGRPITPEGRVAGDAPAEAHATPAVPTQAMSQLPEAPAVGSAADATETSRLPETVQPAYSPQPRAATNAPAPPIQPETQVQPAVQQTHVPQQPLAPQGAYPAPAGAVPQQTHQYSGAETPQTPAGVAFGTPVHEQQHPQAGGGAGVPAFPAAAPTGGNSGGKNRTGALLAGLAIGALLGGVVGGGVAAVVSANANHSSTATASGNSAITLNNAENATAISGVAAVATPSVVTLEVSGASASGSGSGVIYQKDGYIITNAHVVTLDGAAMSDAKIRVKLSDGRIFDGSVVGVDPYADLAVVKVDATDLPAITVADSDKIDVGDLTVAIGAPLNLANTVTSGVVSALNRGISVGSPLIGDDQSQQDDGSGDTGSEGNGDSGNGFPWDFRFGLPDEQNGDSGQQQQSTSSGSVTLPVIQTDASINPGNSGGALLNGNGELIGINVAIASTSTTGDTAGSVGLGFAIPANLATRVADAIIAGEQPSHGLLGASVADSSQDTDADANHAGGLLVDVSSGGAADKAGLKSGDVITAVDGVSAVDGTSVSALIREHAGGSTVKIEYTRGGEPGETEATLGTLEY